MDKERVEINPEALLKLQKADPETFSLFTKAIRRQRESRGPSRPTENTVLSEADGSMAEFASSCIATFEACEDARKAHGIETPIVTGPWKETPEKLGLALLPYVKAKL